MPITLEVNEDIIAKHQDDTRADGFVPLPLTQETKGTILYHKVEAVSDRRSDTQHDPAVPWHDGPFVGQPSVVLLAMQRNPDYEGVITLKGQNVSEDDGIIMHFHGHPIKMYNGEQVPQGFVHVDTRSGVITTPQQAAQNAVISNRVPPKYRMWEFHLESAIWTDGPQRNARLQETAEQQRARAEENMANSIVKAFQSIPGVIGGQPQNLSDIQTPQSLMDNLAAAVEAGEILPEQIDALTGRGADLAKGGGKRS